MNKNGGPAFPRPASTDEHENPCNVYQDQMGMSLRDWFAGMALTGMLAYPNHSGGPEYLAMMAYVQADIMLIEREKQND